MRKAPLKGAAAVTGFDGGAVAILFCVTHEQLTYPAYDAPLMEAYGGRFESVYVMLHPFVSVPEDLAWKVTQQYPSDEQILSAGAKCTWAQVSAETGLGTCARLNQAMLTTIRSIDEALSDYAASKTLTSFLESGSVWMPTEGRFEPLLQGDFLDAFEAAGQEELIFVPEFPGPEFPGLAFSGLAIPGIEAVRRSSVKRLRDGEETFPSRGTLAAPDESFLLTVDWDSFFTLFYGPRAFVDEVVHRQDLEGFFAAPTTEHSWFNYSLGCSAVTVYPDSWVIS